MARITVEDCRNYVDNHFELVMIASKRARQLAGGAEALVDWENDKPTVVALRELAEGKLHKPKTQEEAASDEPSSETSPAPIKIVKPHLTIAGDDLQQTTV